MTRINLALTGGAVNKPLLSLDFFLPLGSEPAAARRRADELRQQLEEAQRELARLRSRAKDKKPPAE